MSKQLSRTEIEKNQTFKEISEVGLFTKSPLIIQLELFVGILFFGIARLSLDNWPFILCPSN